MAELIAEELIRLTLHSCCVGIVKKKWVHHLENLSERAVKSEKQLGKSAEILVHDQWVYIILHTKIAAENQCWLNGKKLTHVICAVHVEWLRSVKTAW